MPIFAGCESFPGFGSAHDRVALSSEGRFNITTSDYIYSRSCNNATTADLTWGHSGSFTQLTGTRAVFHRDELWLEAASLSGLAFGRVLCPHVPLSLHVRATISLDKIRSLCSSITFNNCQSYYDALAYSSGGLRRSSSPSCSNASDPQPDGPLLEQVDHAATRRGIALDDACGNQCTTDTDCAGCGSAGRCSAPPDGGMPSIAWSCVDAPDDPPTAPPPNASAAVWSLASYTATQRLVAYNTFGAQRDVADGRIYYDGAGARLRNEWTHYYNGRLQQQWWVRDPSKNSSRFYVNSATAIGLRVHTPTERGASA
jgi:hypothetical protein